MKKYVRYLFIFALTSFLACAKKEKVSPSLEDIIGPVEIVEDFAVSDDTPEFNTNGKIFFTAKFKEDAYWVITITGNVSGAVKKIEGRTSEINASNSFWDGGADKLPSFRAEALTATLSFPSAKSVTSSWPLSLSMVIQTTKNLTVGHVMVTDFSVDNIHQIFGAFSLPVPPGKWPSDYPPTQTENDTPLKNPDGNRYVMMGPLAPWQDNLEAPGNKSPYVDYLTIACNTVGYPTYFPLIADPSKVYFNMMVYNTGTPYTWLRVILLEDHPTIQDSTITRTTDIRPDWVGWKVVSVNYLDFAFQQQGVVLNNTQRIKSIQLILLSDAPQAILNAGTEPVSVAYDRLIFTHYKPYTP